MSPTQRALSGASPAAPASTGTGGGGTTVIVNVTTNASAKKIVSEAGWELKKRAS
jgi:hypothetical protein